MGTRFQVKLLKKDGATGVPVSIEVTDDGVSLHQIKDDKVFASFGFEQILRWCTIEGGFAFQTGPQATLKMETDEGQKLCDVFMRAAKAKLGDLVAAERMSVHAGISI